MTDAKTHNVRKIKLLRHVIQIIKELKSINILGFENRNGFYFGIYRKMNIWFLGLLSEVDSKLKQICFGYHFICEQCTDHGESINVIEWQSEGSSFILT